MNTIKAVCYCKNMSDENTVLAIERSRFAFIEAWGLSSWLMHAVLSLLSGGLWFFIILGYHVIEIVNPKYHCNQCDSIVPNNQFRL